MITLLPQCLCGQPEGEPGTIHGIAVLTCPKCGIVRQHVEMSPSQLQDWYAQTYHRSVYQHTYEQDCQVADARLGAYALPWQQRILDVGAGNGAFVHRARAQGHDAVGQDLAEHSRGPHVSVGPLEALAFAGRSFDVVTMHDVLEHFVDPVAVLREARRVLRASGMLIVDFPHFWSTAGAHHWKRIEHLWMLDAGQVAELLIDAGFRVLSVLSPIPSKLVFTTTYL